MGMPISISLLLSLLSMNCICEKGHLTIVLVRLDVLCQGKATGDPHALSGQQVTSVRPGNKKHRYFSLNEALKLTFENYKNLSKCLSEIEMVVMTVRKRCLAMAKNRGKRKLD